MYSKELEELIEASIADGVITPQEQAALIRRAQQEGVDPNELAVVVNGRLEKNRQQKKAADEKKRADSRIGSVLKCPQCGAVINRMMGKCPECGHIFTDISVGKSVKSLSEELNRMNHLKKIMGGEKELIKNFPIPNSKDELIDLMIFLKNFESENVASTEINGKIKECIDRCRLLFKDDSEISKIITECEDKIRKDKKSSRFGGIIGLIVAIAIFGVFGFLIFTVNKCENKSDALVDEQLKSLCEQIDSLPTPSATNFDEVSHQILKIVWTPIDANKFKLKPAIQSFVNKKNGYIRAINALGLSEPIPEDAVGNYYEEVSIEEVDKAIEETKRITKKEKDNEENAKNEVQKKVDEQYAALQEKLEALPEVDTDNYENVVAELASLLWTPITDEAETAKKTFKSPSKDEKYERKIKNQWYGEVKAKARIIKAFYNKNTEALGEIDNSDLEKLLENGYIE